MRKALIFLLTFCFTLTAFSAFVTEDDTIATRIQDGKWVSDLDADGADSLVLASLETHLVFSDLISGPDTGLGDGLGSGVIVTVWGFGLGATQGSSTIEFCDSLAACRAGHVYYWKNADGVLPSGPANLHESHGMQEIAFSIPDSAQGAGTIRVTVNGQQSILPFTVRSGAIYHVKPTGNDSTGDGSWGNPWLTIGEADGTAGAGSTIYVGSIIEGSTTTDRAIYWNNASASSTITNQFAIAAYPNSRVDVIGYRGVESYNTQGMVVSKLSVFAAEADVGANDQPVNDRSSVSVGINGSAQGRAVGNYITDEHPSDANGACPNATSGALGTSNLNGPKASGFRMHGNMIEDYGCAGTTKLHHTTYFTNRSGANDIQSEAPVFTYNYLKNNHAKNGIHYYDENQSGDECGDYTTTFEIKHNVVVNQGGAGINIGAACNETGDFEIENNIVINSGRASDWDGQSVATSNGPNTGGIVIGYGGWSGDIVVRNNTIYKWNDDDIASDTQACIGWQTENVSAPATFTVEDNVCWTDKDKPFVNAGCCGAAVPTGLLTMDGNAFYTSVGSPSNAVVPVYATNSITANPLITQTGSRISVDNNSPLVSQSVTGLARDVYGVVRGPASNVGAVQAGTSNVAGIIFETTFDEDAAYSKTNQANFDYVDVPEGWDGVRTNNGSIAGAAGEGVGGSVAMKFTWPQGNGQILANSLFKHLTGNANTGYEELYIRYNVRLPNNFKAGENGEALPFWKWGRLWQNTGLSGSGWTEQRPDSYYIVWNWGDGLPRWGIRNGLTFGENLNTDSLGSAGGPRAGTDWYISGSDNQGHHNSFAGHWDAVGTGAWEFDHTTRFLLDNSTQSWHTIEWRFKLSSTATANDGEFQVWFDGVEQVHPNVIDGIDQTVDQPSTTNSLVTAALPGFNFFTLFDNMAEWSSDQPTEIYINDVVISTSRIGHDYVAQPYSN